MYGNTSTTLKTAGLYSFYQCTRLYFKHYYEQCKNITDTTTSTFNTTGTCNELFNTTNTASTIFSNMTTVTIAT